MAEAEHPGKYIKREVIPDNMSVTKAAQMVGVGRPALSNLLNGNANLSTKMATRLEKAFGASAEELIELQSAYDQAKAKKSAGDLAVRRLVPAFLTIKAADIEQWADRLEAREHLAVLLRKLALTTTRGITWIDFPGFDNSQRHGWDGLLETEEAGPWVPSGRSGWEFGCNKSPASKANSDYNARTRELSEEERKQIYFVFVTPRNWPGKKAWSEEKNGEGKWKSVIALDASDLEQWLDQSIPAQAWLTERLGKPTRSVITLNQSWNEWAGVTEPQMPPELFDVFVEQYAKRASDWLGSDPTEPLTISADSRIEAQAYLACLFGSGSELLQRNADRVVIVRDAETFRSFSKTNPDVIPVIVDDEVEKVVGDAYRRFHTIIFRPRHARVERAGISLEILPGQPFREALEKIDLPSEQIEAWSRESGGSLTVLRRRMSPIEAVRHPAWAADNDLARALAPFALVGVWNSEFEADQTVLTLVAGADEYSELEANIARLQQIPHTPLWSLGEFRGVTSKIDALYGIARHLTKNDLERFFRAAELVLSEDDPALDLPEDDRWAANIYGKTRKHSRASRRAICETLVILVVHAENLFGDRLAIDAASRVRQLIKKLMTPLSPRLLDSQSGDLPSYAEAAPDTFLEIIETDLQQPEPVVLSLLRPAGTGPMSGCPRTGLMWALEALAWNPFYLPRVSLILARLSEQPIEDNWVNKPSNTLGGIFRCWMPQTAASVEMRKDIFETIVHRFPAIAWEIAIEQFDAGSRIGHYNYRPDWRPDSLGAGHPVTNGESSDFATFALEMCLKWPEQSGKSLGDLVGAATGLPEEYQFRIWDLVDEWAKSDASPADKAELKETIRQTYTTRRAQKREVTKKLEGRYKNALDLLTPKDLIEKHRWLFKQTWIDPSADEIEDDEFDWRKRDALIAKKREQAIREIWTGSGSAGILALATGSEAAFSIGRALATQVDDQSQAVTVLGDCLDQYEEGVANALEVFAGFLRSETRNPQRERIVADLLAEASTTRKVNIMLGLQFEQETWDWLEKAGKDVSDRYWSTVHPGILHDNPEALAVAIDKFIGAKRPRVAFSLARFDWKSIDTDRIVNLLDQVAISDEEPAGSYHLQSHAIADAFKELSKREDADNDQIVMMEFRYLQALDHTDYDVPELQKHVGQNPTMYVDSLVGAFIRKNGGEDPEKYRLDDEELRGRRARMAYELLRRLKRIPATNEDGEIDEGKLRDWVVQVRAAAKELDREEVADSQIGQYFAKTPVGEDGVWPCESVRNVLEEIGSQEIGRGLNVGLHNSRGVHWRGEGGSQERDLAKKYEDWSSALATKWPYLARVLHGVASDYEYQAKREDREALIRRRMQR